ncbi:rhamnan synthesis F family protein [Cumulibacter soli]|uniref:rhamnan synthesis F family protein n=1 Tax=Cumulibacter soli TaxID=2546344 RepID=UPI00141A5CF0|nr:rhamnan synthesis F family protein [Cumulibacter soli]
MSRSPRQVPLDDYVVETDCHRDAAPERVAFVASWSPDAQQARSTSELVAQLQQAGYLTVLITTCEDKRPLQHHSRADVDTSRLVTLRRPNVGYDFGSWAVGMSRHADWLAAPYVLVVNDSLVGPFASLEPIIAHFEQSTADLWGLCESRQFNPHLQSFFRGARYGALAEEPMRNFWNGIRIEPTKQQLIERYEVGFESFLAVHGYTKQAFVPASRFSRDVVNPTIGGWRQLLANGVPFVKRQLLLDPSLAHDGDQLRDVVQNLWGIQLDEWL